MKYNCKNCSFHWEGNSDTFVKVLVHEKSHLKNNDAKWLFVTNVATNIMISVWEKQECLIVVVNVLKNRVRNQINHECKF